MDSEQFRKAAHAAIDEVINYYDSIDERRVISAVEPGYLRKILPTGPPQHGEKWEDIQKDIEEKIMPGLTHWQSPNFMAFFPASSTYPGILGELYSGAFTAAAFNWLCSPAITELETIVLDWMADLMALPACYKSETEGGGVIQGSASEAIVTTMVAARDRFLREATAGIDETLKDEKISSLRGRLIALASDQAHSSTHKAALIAGVKFRTVPTVVEDDFAMKGASLTTVLEECEKEGLLPFFLTTTLGSTATCAVDKFEEIAQAAGKNPLLWIHVDAAYAGSALILEEYQHNSKHFEAFNSFNMNMHKWLLTNFDASLLYIKQRRHLVDALSITPSYLRNDFSDSGSVIDYRDWQIPLGRRFRSLKIWFVLRTYGVDGLKAHIKRTIKLGEGFAELVRSRPDVFKILTPPAFALTVIQILPKAGAGSKTKDSVDDHDYLAKEDLVKVNELTTKVHEKIFADGRLFLTSTVVAGHYSIRVVSANPKADEEHVKKAFEVILQTAESIRAA